MFKNRVIKAEVLITRKCNIACDYCNMPIDGLKGKKELAPQQWGDIFNRLTEELNCSFYAIYGAEPTFYSGIYDVIKILNGMEGRAAYSVLTNAILLLQKDIQKNFLDAGLKSITLSMDGVDDLQLDKHISARTNASRKALNWALSHRDVLEDIQVTSTVHRQNIGFQTTELIKFLSENGLWWSFDFVHDNKEKQGYLPVFSKTTSRHEKYAFSDGDEPLIVDFLNQLLLLKSEGYKIYQTDSWLKFLRDHPSKVIQRDWVCDPYPAWLTIDSDGYMLVCDDYFLSAPIYAEDLPDKFEEFIEFRRKALIEGQGCRECIWSTHWMSYEQLKNQAGISHISHGRL